MLSIWIWSDNRARRSSTRWIERPQFSTCHRHNTTGGVFISEHHYSQKKEALRNKLLLNEDGINWSHTDRVTNMWDHLWLMNLKHKTNQQGFNLIFKKGAAVPLSIIKSPPPTKKHFCSLSAHQKESSRWFVALFYPTTYKIIIPQTFTLSME